MGNNSCSCSGKHSRQDDSEHTPSATWVQQNSPLPRSLSSNPDSLAQPKAAASGEGSAQGSHTHPKAAVVNGEHSTPKRPEQPPSETVKASAPTDENAAAAFARALGTLGTALTEHLPLHKKEHEDSSTPGACLDSPSEQKNGTPGDGVWHAKTRSLNSSEQQSASRTSPHGHATDGKTTHAHAKPSKGAPHTEAAAPEFYGVLCADHEQDHKPLCDGKQERWKEQMTCGGIALFVCGAVVCAITVMWWHFGCLCYNIARGIGLACKGVYRACAASCRAVGRCCRCWKAVRACCIKTWRPIGACYTCLCSSNRTWEQRCNLVGRFIFSEGWARKPNWSSLRIEKPAPTIGALGVTLIKAIIHLITAIWWGIGCVFYNIGAAIVSCCLGIQRRLCSGAAGQDGKGGCCDRIRKRFRRCCVTPCKRCCHRCHKCCKRGCCKSCCNTVGRFFFGHGWAAKFQKDRFKEVCNRELSNERLRMQYLSSHSKSSSDVPVPTPMSEEFAF